MKTTIEFRADEPAEKLARMRAHCGVCKYCGEIVKMPRNQQTFELQPGHCWCLHCGQKYYIIIKDIKKWEIKQWEQKAENMNFEVSTTTDFSFSEYDELCKKLYNINTKSSVQLAIEMQSAIFKRDIAAVQKLYKKASDKIKKKRKYER